MLIINAVREGAIKCVVMFLCYKHVKNIIALK